MKLCPNCGIDIRDIAAFCDQCRMLLPIYPRYAPSSFQMNTVPSMHYNREIECWRCGGLGKIRDNWHILPCPICGDDD